VAEHRDDFDDGDTVSITPVARGEAGPHPRGDACLVVIYGPELGRRIPLVNVNFEIGRSSKSDLTIDQESISRHHARISAVGGGTHAIVDLGSTNGTYVNDRPVAEQRLSDGDQIKIGRSILKFMTGENIEHSYHEEIYRLVTVDGLTQLFNKRYFTEALERELNRARRYRRELSLFLFDVDHFKDKNDRYGHVAGDFLLKQLAQEVKPKLRREDLFARVGGEEFGVLLPEVGLDGARITAEKVRRVVEEAEFSFDEHVIPCTVSIGVATLEPSASEEVTENDEQGATLYAAADAALYRAKQGGRNRIES